VVLFLALALVLNLLLSVPAVGYSHSGAVAYASEHCRTVCSDGYFFPRTGIISLPLGSSIVGVSGNDCAHFVSCCIGSEPNDSGGGLNVPSRALGNYWQASDGLYGFCGADRLVRWLLQGEGTIVDSVEELQPGDVVAFSSYQGAQYSHVALYIGDRKYAAHTYTTCARSLDGESDFKTYIRIGNSRVTESLDRRITALVKQAGTAPPYLMTVDGFAQKVGYVGRRFSDWINKTDLTARYEEMYSLGQEYAGLAVTVLADARKALNAGDIDEAEALYQRAERYIRASTYAYDGAIDVFEGQTEVAIQTANAIKNGCEAAVSAGVTIAFPGAAPLVDNLYRCFDFGVTWLMYGFDEATKELAVSLATKAIFNDFTVGGRSLSSAIGNRIGKEAYPIVQAYLSDGQAQLFVYRALKAGGVSISQDIVGKLLDDALNKFIDGNTTSDLGETETGGAASAEASSTLTKPSDVVLPSSEAGRRQELEFEFSVSSGTVSDRFVASIIGVSTVFCKTFGWGDQINGVVHRGQLEYTAPVAGQTREFTLQGQMTGNCQPVSNEDSETVLFSVSVQSEQSTALRTPTGTTPGTTSKYGPALSSLTPKLQWNAVSGATHYALAISEYPFTSSPRIVVNPQLIYGTSYTVPSGALEYGEKYRWNMQAIRGSEQSDISITLYFQTPDEPQQQQAPTCSLDASPRSGTAPLTVTFTLGAADAEGSIARWELDVDGNGSADYQGTGNPPTVRSHTYATSGSFNTRLTVWDGNDASATDTIGISVGTANLAPTCSLEANPTSGTAPLPVTFTLSATDAEGSIDRWELDIDGNGSADYSGSGNPPTTRSHTYTSSGSFNARLTVWDGNDASASDTEGISVETADPPPTCNLSANQTSGTAPFIVTFSMTASDPGGSISRWELDIDGDGSSDYSWGGSPPSTQIHTYTNSGSYTARLKVWDSMNALASDTVGISVAAANQPPTCNLSANQTSGTAPLTVTFSMNASDPGGSIAAWLLDVDGDGSSDYSGTGYPPSTYSHTYYSGGNYGAVLSVQDGQGLTSFDSLTISVDTQNQPPTCNLDANQTSGTAPFTVRFSISADDSDGDVSPWAINFGDGSNDSGNGIPPSSISHTYGGEGTYTVILMVADDDDATASSIETIFVASAPGIQVGDRVKVDENMNVRDCAGTGCDEIDDPDYPGTAVSGTRGTVIDGPEYSAPYIWWEVEWDPGYTGWSIENGLIEL